MAVDAGCATAHKRPATHTSAHHACPCSAATTGWFPPRQRLPILPCTTPTTPAPLHLPLRLRLLRPPRSTSGTAPRRLLCQRSPLAAAPPPPRHRHCHRLLWTMATSRALRITASTPRVSQAALATAALATAALATAALAAAAALCRTPLAHRHLHQTRALPAPRSHLLLTLTSPLRWDASCWAVLDHPSTKGG